MQSFLVIYFEHVPQTHYKRVDACATLTPKCAWQDIDHQKASGIQHGKLIY